ncbi:O-acetyl-L-homoserine sulfhydrylase [Sporomusa carbonis]|uniref:PLP-dependent transferase n=1 Tax=Sporomusa carbonis TaxID=3076075 RepID=UPI003A704AE3
MNKFPSLREFAKFGKFAYLAKLCQGLFKDFGACLAPFNAFLTGTGLETLGLRMERLCDNAQKLALFLRQHDKVVAVNYP